MNRRDFIRLGTGAALLATTGQARSSDVPQRAVIPSTGLSVTRVGLGTWRTFDAGSDPARRARLAEVLRDFADVWFVARGARRSRA